MHRQPLNRQQDFERWPPLAPGQWLDFNPTVVALPDHLGGGRLAIVRRDHVPPQPGRGTLWVLPVDEQLRPDGAADLLIGRGEDPRALVLGDRLLVFYCVIDRDEADAVAGSTMMLAEFALADGRPTLLQAFGLPKNPLQLARPGDRGAVWEKNWVPFEISPTQVGLIYSHDPWHVIALDCDPATAARRFVGHFPGPQLAWRHGHIRGGTPPVPYGDDQLITFFHSSAVVGSRKVYAVGACRFDRSAPYTPRAITREPLLLAPYNSGAHRFGWPFAGSVVFPLGAQLEVGGYRLLAGLDDGEIASFLVRHDALAERLDPVDALTAVSCSDADENSWSANGPLLLRPPGAALTADLAQARFLQGLVGSGRSFVDWGAGHGTAAVLLAERFDRVLAFEAAPARRRLIERQALVNDLPRLCVQPLPAAIDDAGLDAVDLLRVDCPETLAAVLAGAAQLLRRCRPVLFLHLPADTAAADAVIDTLTADAYECKRLAVHHPDWLVALPAERRAAWNWWY